MRLTIGTIRRYDVCVCVGVWGGVRVRNRVSDGERGRVFGCEVECVSAYICVYIKLYHMLCECFIFFVTNALYCL